MLTVAILEDDPVQLEQTALRVQAQLEQRGYSAQVFRYARSAHLLDSGMDFDLAFLDIGMAGMDGMEAARRLRAQERACVIVFLTALPEYVYDAFSVDAAGYLLKPVDAAQLAGTLERVLKKLVARPQACLTFHSGQNFHTIAFARILYGEVYDHTTLLHLQEDCLRYPAKLDQLARQLPEDFFRCHRSYIVRLGAVQGYTDGMAHLSNRDRVPVAKRRRASFVEALVAYHRKEARGC